MTERSSSNRDRGDWGADPELRALVRCGDPAHFLPPRSGGDLSRLVESVLAADVAQAPVVHHGPRRSRLPLLVAAAAAVVVAGVGVHATTGNHDDGSGAVAVDRAPTTGAPTASADDGPTLLEAPGVTSTRCMTPNVDILQLQQIAFEGSVTAIDGSTVTLSPTSVFTGAVADTVQIQAPGPEMVSLLSAVRFEVGRSYLVSASDGQVTLCGFSAEAAPGLRTLYQQAFGG